MRNFVVLAVFPISAASKLEISPKQYTVMQYIYGLLRDYWYFLAGPTYTKEFETSINKTKGMMLRTIKIEKNALVLKAKSRKTIKNTLIAGVILLITVFLFLLIMRGFDGTLIGLSVTYTALRLTVIAL